MGCLAALTAPFNPAALAALAASPLALAQASTQNDACGTGRPTGDEGGGAGRLAIPVVDTDPADQVLGLFRLYVPPPTPEAYQQVRRTRLPGCNRSPSTWGWPSLESGSLYSRCYFVSVAVRWHYQNVDISGECHEMAVLESSAERPVEPQYPPVHHTTNRRQDFTDELQAD